MNRNDPAVRRTLRAIRRSFENETGLRTHAISFIRARSDADLFDADAPFNSSGEEAVLQWMEKAEQESGKALDFEIRNTRMTVRFASQEA